MRVFLEGTRGKEVYRVSGLADTEGGAGVLVSGALCSSWYEGSLRTTLL